MNLIVAHTGARSEPRGLSAVRWWMPVLFASLAGAMGWGIRGQYGHETGAMIAGLLVSLVLVLLLAPEANALRSVRAVAWCTVAIGFGGSMTYGQTIGLTQDAPLIGNWAALRWGLLGLAIKGGIWIGFAGVFFGMGLSGSRYRSRELLLLMLILIALFFAGSALFNSPFDPSQRILPRIYFSDDWRWEPGADLKPRREDWGGLLFALAGTLCYAGVMRRDRLALNLGLWGIAGGALGFPIGQSLQAFHAWHPELFREGWLAKLDPQINWWNMMETTFGAIFGAVLGLGTWLNRRRISLLEHVEENTPHPAIEWLWAALHVTLLVAGELLSAGWAAPYVNLSLLLGVIPIVAIAAGSWWPYLLILPITVLPIAGKTLRQLCYREAVVAPEVGWAFYLLAPMVATLIAALWLRRRANSSRQARDFARPALLLATWLYFGLNFAFFRFPWPWEPWTTRTPNAMIFTVCAVGLTVAVVLDRCRKSFR